MRQRFKQNSCRTNRTQATIPEIYNHKKSIKITQNQTKALPTPFPTSVREFRCDSFALIAGLEGVLQILPDFSAGSQNQRESNIPSGNFSNIRLEYLISLRRAMQLALRAPLMSFPYVYIFIYICNVKRGQTTSGS